MAVAVDITAVQFQIADGALHCTGTVGGQPPVTVAISPDEVVGLTVAEIQNLIAIRLAQLSTVNLSFTSFNGIVNL